VALEDPCRLVGHPTSPEVRVDGDPEEALLAAGRDEGHDVEHRIWLHGPVADDPDLARLRGNEEAIRTVIRRGDRERPAGHGHVWLEGH
jgi:hypothetical protein